MTDDSAFQRKSHSNSPNDISGSVQHRKASGDSFTVPPGDPGDHHLQPEHQVHPSKWSDLLNKYSDGPPTIGQMSHSGPWHIFLLVNPQ